MLNRFRSDHRSSALSQGEQDWRSESRLVRSAVAGLTQGDVEALHFLYVRYAPDVFACVSELVQDGREAEIVTQGVFARLPAEIGGYEDGAKPFAVWLVEVARAATREYLNYHPHASTAAR